jgi:hypothetical protein
MKSFSSLQVWSLVFVFASTIAAIPVDTNDDLSRGDDARAALGKRPRQEPSSMVPNTTSSTPDLTAPVARVAMTPYMFGCTGEQQIKVQEAWVEAGELADAHAKWNPPSTFKKESFQPAMSMYMGSDSSKDKPFFGQGPLKKNILREQGIHRTNQDWSPFWSYAYFYCDESKLPSKFKPEKPHCGGPGQPGQNVAAYTFSDDGRLSWNAKYVVFCPRFFQPDVLSLADRVASALENPALQKVIDPWRRVRASIMVHETYHWGPAEVSDPRCDRRPEIYDAAGVVKLAATENVAGSRTNGMINFPLFSFASFTVETNTDF